MHCFVASHIDCERRAQHLRAAVNSALALPQVKHVWIAVSVAVAVAEELHDDPAPAVSDGHPMDTTFEKAMWAAVHTALCDVDTDRVTITHSATWRRQFEHLGYLAAATTGKLEDDALIMLLDDDDLLYGTPVPNSTGFHVGFGCSEGMPCSRGERPAGVRPIDVLREHMSRLRYTDVATPPDRDDMTHLTSVQADLCGTVVPLGFLRAFLAHPDVRPACPFTDRHFMALVKQRTEWRAAYTRDEPHVFYRRWNPQPTWCLDVARQGYEHTPAADVRTAACLCGFDYATLHARDAAGVFTHSYPTLLARPVCCLAEANATNTSGLVLARA